VQKGTAAAVASVTRQADARAALAPVADAPDVIAGGIDEQNVGALVSALSPALESSTGDCERGEAGIVIYYGQDICILRIALGGCQ